MCWMYMIIKVDGLLAAGTCAQMAFSSFGLCLPIAPGTGDVQASQLWMSRCICSLAAMFYLCPLSVVRWPPFYSGEEIVHSQLHAWLYRYMHGQLSN